MTIPLPLRKPHLRSPNIKHSDHTAQEGNTQRPGLLDTRLRPNRAVRGAVDRGVGAGDQQLLGGLLEYVAADLDAERGRLGVAGGGEQDCALDLDQLWWGWECAVEGLDQ